MKNLFLTVGLVLLAACASEAPIEKEENTEAKSEDKEMASSYRGFRNEFKQKAEVFNIDASKDITLKTKNGSRIHISKNSFVRADGQKVKGNVNFEVMEFNTHGEIIASNIPMVYKNTNGENEQFKSAGMFSLAAHQNNEELYLEKGKKIKVEYATDVDGAFNFYKLEKDSSNWQLKETDLLAVPNPYLNDLQEKLNTEKSLEPKKPKRPLAAAQGDELFDLMIFEGSQNEMNHQFNGLMWKYIGADPSLNPAKDPSKFKRTKVMTSVEPKDTTFLAFTMEFQDKVSKEKFTIDAAPIHQGIMLDRGEKKYKETIEKIEKSARAQQAILKEMENEKELLRIFNVEELGIYNYDIKYKDENNLPFAANFTFEGQDEDYVNVYLLPTEQRIVVKYTPDTYKEFSINPKNTNRLVAILPTKEVYVLGNQEIKKMNLDNKARDSKITFDLKKVNKSIETPADLDKVLKPAV